MKYIKKISEDKVFKFNDYNPTKYNGNIIVTNIMEWLRAHLLDNDKNKETINVPLNQFLAETQIDINKLKTFINEQNKTDKLESFKIKIENNYIIFYDFKKNTHALEDINTI